MFLRFNSNEERRTYGGTRFIEIQYCKLRFDTSDKKIVSINAINNWELTSLYVYNDNIDDFLNEYKNIFNNGLYNNMSEGVIDLYGINYYNEEKAKRIIESLKSFKPIGFEILHKWLNENPYHNGFYILGI